jgi:hypothetical protein
MHSDDDFLHHQLFGKSCGFLFCPIIIDFSGCLPDAFTQKATDNFFLDNLVPSISTAIPD